MDIIYKPILKLHKKIEKILEEDSSSDIENKKTQDSFELTTLIPHFSLEGLPPDELDRVAWIFSQLVPFFNKGLLISKQNQKVKVVAQFDRGVMSHTKKESTLTMSYDSIPFLSFMKYKGRSQPFSQFFSHSHEQPPDSSDLFFVKLTPDFSILLALKLASPWQRSHLEKIQMFINQAMSL